MTRLHVGQAVLLPVLAALFTTLAPAAGHPATAHAKVSRASVAAVEKSLDKRLLGLWPGSPMQVIGLTQGTYLLGFGAVFTSEVNLALGPGVNPFHQTVTRQELEHLRQKKLARLPQFREAMRDMLVASAASLDGVPEDEQVALSISLFHWNWEDAAGLPLQIVMQAPRKTLLAVQTGRLPKTELASAIQVQEY